MSVPINAVVAEPRQTQAWLTANNPILPPGVTYVETDTNRSKRNPSLATPLAWNDLAYDNIGPPGDPGPSNYDLAVANGYTGTVTEWLDDPVNGAKGATGTPGVSFLFVVGLTIPTVQNPNTLYGRK